MDGRIAVYGATGRLGRLVIAELAHLGARVRLGGRDAGALATLADSLDGAEWRAAQLDDRAALRDFLGGCRVVVNCAGASSVAADRLIAAALDAPVHYIDAAGEQTHVRRLFEQRSEAAGNAGIALVAACGFDYALGDCLARLVARERQPAREVVVAYAIGGAEVGANSLQFAAETAGGGEVTYESGAWKPVRISFERRTIDFPPPFGRQPVTRYGSAEVVTVPRHTTTDAVTSLVTVSSLVPHPALIPVFPYLRPIVAIVRRTPARHVLALAMRLRRPAAQASASPPAGPRFAILAWVEASGGPADRGIIEGGDFHQITAATLAFAARTMASREFSGRGALPPALAMDPRALLNHLGRLGVTWRLERSGTTPHTR